MKKLISIKTDESGETVYFTHKNGVDTVLKNDIVDLELVNPIFFRKKLGDGQEIMRNYVISLLVLLSIVILINVINEVRIFDYKFFFGISSFVFVSFFIYYSINLIMDKRNSRNRLKIYF